MPYGNGRRPGYVDLSKPRRRESDPAAGLAFAMIASVVMLGLIVANLIIWL